MLRIMRGPLGGAQRMQRTGVCQGGGDAVRWLPPMIYLDHAATTPVRPEVLEAMLPYFSERFGNPSSVHRAGIEAAKGVFGARRAIGSMAHVPALSVVFTGGG